MLEIGTENPIDSLFGGFDIVGGICLIRTILSLFIDYFPKAETYIFRSTRFILRQKSANINLMQKQAKFRNSNTDMFPNLK